MRLGMIESYQKEGFENVKNLGLDALEICLNFDEESEKFLSSTDIIKNNIKETGIPVSSVGRWNSKPNVNGKIDEKVFELQVNTMKAAKEIGSPVFVCGCNYSDTTVFKNYATAIEYFGRIAEEAKKIGIVPAVYNCSWENFVYSPQQWKFVLEEVPELMIKYDCSHAFCRGADYLAELNEWLPRVAHMHVKGELRVKGEIVYDPPAGMDNIDWRSVFALIYRHGYNGTLSIEPHSDTFGGSNKNIGAEFTRDFIRPFILR